MFEFFFLNETNQSINLSIADSCFSSFQIALIDNFFLKKDHRNSEKSSQIFVFFSFTKLNTYFD